MRRHRTTAGAPTPLRGALEVPGDKSVTHRALIIAALSAGRSTVANANLGRDCLGTAALLSALGAACEVDEAKAQVEVEGRGAAGLREAEGVLDAGNSGTTMRMMLGVCAAIEGLSVLTGDASLRRRPMLRVVVPLRRMGAMIDGRAHGDRAPLVVRGGALDGIEIDLPVASAQVKTAVLLAGLRAEGPTTVSEPTPTRDHTERMLLAAGADVDANSKRVVLRPGPALEARKWEVPGDISSGLFLLAAAVIIEGSHLTLTNLSFNRRRAQALSVMERMGADLAIERTGERCGEPVGTVTVRASKLTATNMGGDEIPALIDELPILAVLASCAEGETVISDASELRLKESDRIEAMVAGLQSLGVDCEARPDGMVIRGPANLTGGEVDSHGDHRVAMSLAVAGLRTYDPVRVRGWGCVNTSFPEFLDLLGRAQGRRA